MDGLFSEEGLRVLTVPEEKIDENIRAYDDTIATLGLNIDMADPQTQVRELKLERKNLIFRRAALARRLGDVGLGDDVFAVDGTAPNLFDQLERV